MKNLRMKISDLKVQSFVTSFEESKENTVLGGRINPSRSNCMGDGCGPGEDQTFKCSIYVMNC